MHSLSLDLIPDSTVSAQRQSVPAANECHGLCNNRSSQVLDRLPLYSQQVLLRKLASALNRNHRKAKMQDKHHRLQHTKSRRGKQQQAKVEGKELLPYPGNAKKRNESEQKSPQSGNSLALTPNLIINTKCTNSSEAVEVNYRTRVQEIFGTVRSRHLPVWLSFEMDQNYRSSRLSSKFQTSTPSVPRSRNLPLFEFKSCQKSLIKECSEEQPPDAALGMQDAVFSMNAATDDKSLSSVCTFDKESGQLLGIASHSFDFCGNCEKKSKPVDGAVSNESGFPQASPSLTSQPIVSCENSNVQADKAGASNYWYQHANEIVFEQVAKAKGVDVGDSGSSTSGSKVFRPLLLQPLIQNNSNEYSAAVPKADFTEYSINAADRKPLVSKNDPDEVQQITLLDILANAAIGASVEDSPVFQKFQGVDIVSQRQAKRKLSYYLQHSILEAKPAEALRLPKGLFIHRNVEYTQKQATRYTVSILKRFQSLSSENFGVDAESIWAPLQGKDKQVHCIDQIGSTLHQTPKSENFGFANRSNLRRTAGLPVRLRDSVIELQSKKQSRFKPNF